MSRQHAMIAMCSLACVLTGCAGRGAMPQKQTTDEWRKRWVQPTEARPVALNRTPDGSFDLQFWGRRGAERIIVVKAEHANLSVSPNATMAASISFDPPTRARWVTFFDRSGEVQSQVLLPTIPAAAEKMFFHGLSIILSDSGEAIVTLTHGPFVDVVLPAGQEPKGLGEMFFVDVSGQVKPIAMSDQGGLQVLLPPRGGFALLRIQTDYSAKANRVHWTLERYAKGFKLAWKKNGDAYGVYPARYKYDVSLSVERLSVAGAEHEYLHFLPDGSVERQAITPTTHPATE